MSSTQSTPSSRPVSAATATLRITALTEENESLRQSNEALRARVAQLEALAAGAGAAGAVDSAGGAAAVPSAPSPAAPAEPAPAEPAPAEPAPAEPAPAAPRPDGAALPPSAPRPDGAALPPSALASEADKQQAPAVEAPDAGAEAAAAEAAAAEADAAATGARLVALLALSGAGAALLAFVGTGDLWRLQAAGCAVALAAAARAAVVPFREASPLDRFGNPTSQVRPARVPAWARALPEARALIVCGRRSSPASPVPKVLLDAALPAALALRGLESLSLRDCVFRDDGAVSFAASLGAAALAARAAAVAAAAAAADGSGGGSGAGTGAIVGGGGLALTHLDLHNVGVSWSGESRAALAQFWPRPPQTRNPDPQYPPKPTNRAAPSLCVALKALPRLVSLDISGNGKGFGNAGAVALSALLPRLPCLEVLIVADNGIFAAGGGPLFKALPPTLTSLDVSGNSLYAAGAAALAAAVPALPRLESLNIARNELKADGVAALAAAFPALGRSLAALDLSGNAIGIPGATTLGAALPALARLDRLSLAGAEMYALGASQVARALPRMPALRVLDASGLNSLGNEGKAALRAAADAINKDGGATRLDLRL